MANESEHVFSNHPDYPLLRESLAQLLRADPFSRYGAHAVGIGPKAVAGKLTDRLALRFYVACKLPAAQLPRERRIPGSFPAYSGKDQREVELITDVVESPPGEMLVDLGSELRPVPGGASCSSITYVGTGTIGGWVWDNTDDTIVMLSNQHVFGNTLGGAIIQPGTADGGESPQHRIGQVKRRVPMMTYRGRPVPDDCNYVDAAIGEADSSELFDLTVVDLGPAVYEVDDPAAGDAVEKTGQTTGHTVGVITDANYNTTIDNHPDGPVVMCDCLRIEPADPAELFSSNGDSGSIVFRQVEGSVIKPALGLLFGGGGVPPNNYGIACKINNVFAALDLGPLCIAGCAAFVDALYADESENDGGDHLRTPDVGPPLFTARERRRRRSHRFHSGLTLDVQKRLMTSLRGRGLLGVINRHRSEILTLVVKDGDTRRAMVAALRPILAGAVTTTDVLERKLTAQDVERLNRMLAVGSGNGTAELRKSLEALHALLDGATGRSLAEVLAIEA